MAISLETSTVATGQVYVDRALLFRVGITVQGTIITSHPIPQCTTLT